MCYHPQTDKELTFMNRLLRFIAPLICLGGGLLSAQSQPVYTISTVAGTGNLGEGGPATAAQLSSPDCLAVDSSGALFIADANNHRIRKVSAAGDISTVAGTGTAGFSGDGAAATRAMLNSPQAVWVDNTGNVLIADSNN